MSTEQQSTDDNDSSGFDIQTTPTINYELSDNIAEDIVDYARGNVIQNERQCYMLSLCWTSGWMEDEDNFLSTVLLGSPSGGKTHVTRTMKQLLPENSYYSSTSGSAMSFLDDSSWNSKRVIVLSELQKLDGQILEYLKSTSSGDGGYTYARSVPDDSDAAQAGDRTTQKIEKEPKPFSMSYAGHEIDHELADRLLFIHIDEGKKINKSVGMMQADHEDISVDLEGVGIGGDDSEYSYIYDTTQLELALKRRWRDIPNNSYVHMPEWCFFAFQDCLDWGRSDVKRSSSMIPSLIKASCLQNFEDRPTIEEDVDGSTVEKYVVQPTDVANVLSCRRVLLGTTHQYTPQKQSIVNAVRANTQMSDYCSLNDIQNWLQNNAKEVSKMRKQALRDILSELEEAFIINTSERYFDNGGHGYTFESLSDIGAPKLTGFRQLDYSSENPLMGVEDGDDPFEGVVNPFTGQDFKESVSDFRDSLRRSVSASASTAMQGSDDDDGQPQSTLDGDTTESMDVDLTSVESVVYDRAMSHADGKTFQDDVGHETVLGLRDEDGGLKDTGTILNPDHDAWQPNDGVSSVSDANRGVEDALESLMAEGVVTFVATDDGVGRIDVTEIQEVEHE